MINGIALNLPDYIYGILFVVAYLAGLWLFRYNSSRFGLTMPDLVDLSLITCISGLVGARIAYILLFPDHFNRLRDYLAIYEGGLVFYGGLIAFIASMAMFCRFKSLSFRQLFDMLSPSAALGHAIGRLGCLNNHCCYGAPTTCCQIYRLPDDPPGLFRHPTQLYESVFLFCLMLALNQILKKVYSGQTRKTGLTGGIYLASYAIFRFMIEFIRADNRGGFYTALSLSPSQITAVILLLCSTALMAYAVRYPVDTRGTTDEQS
ncbi:MAG: prolipoprotein diacylglyceryl transferase [Candidatus Riflebacteria bacterium HGW-Riflebacteria-2]|jgi:phosphatidylglycerol:prolipoprotein diacylglycerol transferase|nr:MAG: prolipoprotein diacylglyceryl transferase [Candidatus Riflebacteria bacterium HGW-Riflebacteria-2]